MTQGPGIRQVQSLGPPLTREARRLVITLRFIVRRLPDDVYRVLALKRKGGNLSLLIVLYLIIGPFPSPSPTAAGSIKDAPLDTNLLSH